MGQATAQFVGATNFRRPLALIGLYRHWLPTVRRLKESSGYLGHRVWFAFPFTFGTIAFFADRDSMLTFARCPEHARLIQWVMRPGNARGGFIRFWQVLPDGYSSGVWRVEPPHEMKAIDRYSPLQGEMEPPLVADRARAQARK
jgi:hypothetical protein